MYATNSRYDAILVHREKQRQAAELREARSEARRQAAEQAQARSDALRNTMSNTSAQVNNAQSQLLTQIIQSRMATQAAQKADATKWYR